MTKKVRPHRLSKSRVMKGIQCHKALYLTVNEPDVATDTTPAQQAIFDQGHAVGHEAQKRFPGGKLIEASHTEPERAVADTAKAITAGVNVLFEAGFIHDGVLVRVDVLKRDNAKAPWQIFEVKSSTKVSDTHIQDAAVQAWVLRGAGFKVKSVSVMHINNQCVAPNLKDLFATVDVTKDTAAFAKEVPAIVAKLKKVIEASKAPAIDIGPHCSDPYDCAFWEHCQSQKKLADYTVFDLPGITSRAKWGFYFAGRSDLAKLDLKRDKLTATQRRAVEASISKKRFIDPEPIIATLKSWKYPLYYLDFETIGHAVPRYDGLRPYQQVPFQLSSHIQDRPDGPTRHIEYLHEDGAHPGEALVRALLQAVGTEGSVVAYSMSYEARCIEDLAKAYPKQAKALRAIVPRLVDPLPIVRAAVYDREFRGSFSIKAVAPAILGQELSYDGLAVPDGTAAQIAFEELISPETPTRRKVELKRGMLEYCKQDTFAMVKLVEWLRKVSKVAKVGV